MDSWRTKRPETREAHNYYIRCGNSAGLKGFKHSPGTKVGCVRTEEWVTFEDKIRPLINFEIISATNRAGGTFPC